MKIHFHSILAVVSFILGYILFTQFTWPNTVDENYPLEFVVASSWLLCVVLLAFPIIYLFGSTDTTYIKLPYYDKIQYNRKLAAFENELLDQLIEGQKRSDGKDKNWRITDYDQMMDRIQKLKSLPEYTNY